MPKKPRFPTKAEIARAVVSDLARELAFGLNVARVVERLTDEERRFLQRLARACRERRAGTGEQDGAGRLP